MRRNEPRPKAKASHRMAVKRRYNDALDRARLVRMWLANFTALVALMAAFAAFLEYFA